ncbi:MAG: hypothetical protein R3B96_14515 [Pirellulaceae bacterium]
MLAGCLLTAATTTLAQAQQPESAAEWLPDSTVLYVELERPSELVDLVLEHPLRPRIEALDAVKQAKSEKPYRDIEAGVSMLEAQLGMPWTSLLSSVAGERVVVAFDIQSLGVAVGLQSSDPETADRLLDKLIELARADAQANGRPDPVREATIRDLKVYRVGDARLARLGDWTWVTNKDALGRSMVHAYLDGRESSLASAPHFAAALETRQAGQLWAFAEIERLRILLPPNAIPERTDNPGAELLVGGFFDLARHIPYISASAAVETDGLSVVVATPLESDWKSDVREYWWGKEETGAAPSRLQVDNAVAQIEFHRDISEMWLRAGDLFVDQTIDQLDQADSTLSTLFLGADFAEDILGAFEPSGHLIVARQTFDDPAVTPDIKLPAFALVFTMEQPERMQPQLRHFPEPHRLSQYRGSHEWPSPT